MKTKLIITAISIILIFISGFFLSYNMLHKEIQRLENNFLSTQEELYNKSFKTIRALNIEVSEFKDLYKKETSELKKENIKLRNLITFTNMNTQTVTNVNTSIRDSVICDTILAKVASFKDSYTDFSMVVIDTFVNAKITTYDSISCILYKQPRKFSKWLRGEPKKVMNTITNKNPNSKITYQRVIRINKKRDL